MSAQPLAMSKAERAEWRQRLSDAHAELSRTLQRPAPTRQAVVASATTSPPRKETTVLTPEELDTARQLIARMNSPLSEDEKRAAKLVGVSEEAYKETRDTELAAKLPGGPEGLEASELEVCRLLGMKPADFAAEKKRLAAEGA